MTKADMKILICDDSVLARKNLKNNLFEMGCTNVIEVSDGQAAIDTYKAERPDLMFLDIVMPVKDGITAVKEIREFDGNAHIVMLSSVGTQEHLREAIKLGAQDFMQKPASIDHIRHVINHILGGK